MVEHEQHLAHDGETTCDGQGLNRSAYWVPSLYDAHGERVRYVDPLFYYKTGYHVPAASIVTPPYVGTGRCPSSHPVAIPEISYNFSIYVSADMGPSCQWRFPSDKAGAIGGSILQGDWMDGWDQTTMGTIVQNCLVMARECMVGLLGDGTRLAPIPLD